MDLPQRRPRSADPGSRLAARRRERGLSRRALAELVGRSEEWLRQIENGSRRLDSLTVAMRLAEVLHLEDLGELVDQPIRWRRSGPWGGPLLAVMSRAVCDQPSVVAPARAGESASPADHRQIAEELWQTWWYSPRRYSELGARLPAFLAELRAAGLATAPGNKVAETLVTTYHLVRSFLARLGDWQLGLVVADRGMLIAERESLPCRYAAARSAAMAYLQAGLYPEALALAEVTTDRVPDGGTDLLLWGACRTVAAKAAAELSEPARAYLLLGEVTAAATAIGADRREAGVWFGPSDAHLTGMYVALTLGRLDEVLDRAARAELATGFPPNLRTAHLIMLALACARRRRDAAAVPALLKVEQVCPEEIRYDATVAATLRLLLRRDHPAWRSDVTRLAGLAGVR